MNKMIKSKFRILGGATIMLFLSILVGFLCYNLFYLEGNTEPINKKIPNGFFNFWILVIVFICFNGLIKELRLIKTDVYGITIVTPILLFYKRQYNWNHFQGFYTVKESSRSGTHEAIYLVRNGRLNKRISSFTYRNYGELKDSLQTKNFGELKGNYFTILYYYFGGKIKP